MIAKVLWTINTRSVALHFCKINLTFGQRCESQPEMQWPGNISCLLKNEQKIEQISLTRTSQNIVPPKANASFSYCWNCTILQRMMKSSSKPRSFNMIFSTCIYRLFIWSSNTNFILAYQCAFLSRFFLQEVSVLNTIRRHPFLCQYITILPYIICINIDRKIQSEKLLYFK